jgi:hypothetical protein
MAGGLVEHLEGDCYRVNVQRLRELFEKSVVKYEEELRDVSRQENKELNAKFNAMFPKHARPMSVFKMQRGESRESP